MHCVVELAGGEFRQTQIVFAVFAEADDCFPSPDAPDPVPLTVAGFDALYVEPYLTDLPSSVQFVPSSGATTGAYALAIDDRTLCVYLSWDRTTTADELDAARQVVESIRGQAYGPGGIRIVFTIPAGWDTG